MTSVTRFDLLGHGLQVEGVSASLLAWLEDYWGFPYSQTFSSTPVKLRVLTEKPNDYPSGIPTTLTFPEGEVRCINHDPVVWLGSAACGVRLDLRGDMELELWGDDTAQFAMLHIALTEVLRVKGFLPLHAAVVVKDGAATAFLGASGAGKTTTLLSAVDQGWQALCEDFMWLEPTTLRVYRWDRGVRLLPDTAERFSRLVGYAPNVLAAGKYFVRYHDLGWSAPEGVLANLLWLRRGHEPSTPRPLTKVEAVRLLWEAAGVPMSRVAREQASRTIPQLIDRVNPEQHFIGDLALSV